MEKPWKFTFSAVSICVSSFTHLILQWKLFPGFPMAIQNYLNRFWLGGPGGKIIENILFGAAFTRRVFWSYSSGTQWSRCYKVVLAILPWNKVESRLEYSCHTALEHWVPAEYSQNTVLAEYGNSHGFHQLIEILNVVYLKC